MGKEIVQIVCIEGIPYIHVAGLLNAIAESDTYNMKDLQKFLIKILKSNEISYE